MTQYKPFIIVKRLIITQNGIAVYDENFHEGVNIIRGKNSSGKSTIADFVFYALGGDLVKWKMEAKSCDYTYMEVSLNGKIFTLKREIKERSRKGMDIFSGDIDAATKSGFEGWLRYPYNATENKESYYQVLLKVLGIPYSKSDDKTSITLHQLLRLMYVDQMTSLDRLFKFDRFDSPNKRKAIGELLMGLSDFELYECRVRAQRIGAMLDSKIKEIKILHSFFGDELKSLPEIDKIISKKNIQIEELEAELLNDGAEQKDSDQEAFLSLRKEITAYREVLRKQIEEKSSYNYEISDSQLFVASLQARLEAIGESQLVICALSDIGFHYCPSCFNVVQPEKVGCKLCGIDIKEEDSDNDPTFKIRKEIEFQISESNYLIKTRQEKLVRIDLEINQQQSILENSLRGLASLERPLAEVSVTKRKLLLKIGAINREITELNESKTKHSKLHELYHKREILQNELTELEGIIEKKEKSLEGEYSRKKRALSDLTKNILQADDDHEEIFLDGKKVDFDFAEDKVSIDDRVLFSASSMVYLKNAFRLAMLEASCIDSSYLYPRFLLMDNVEDKGMAPVRSQTFQKEIVRISNGITVPHQIIFTTSMISPDLDIPLYCIGDKYDENNKTLNFKPTHRRQLGSDPS